MKKETQEEYLVSIDKNTYDLIKKYLENADPHSQPFSNKYISYTAQMMIHEYLASKKDYSLPWAFGIVFLFSLGELISHPKTWAIFTEPFSITTIITFLIMISAYIFLGLIIGIFSGAMDYALKKSYNIEYRSNKIKQSIFPIIIFAFLLTFTILYVTS